MGCIPPTRGSDFPRSIITSAIISPNARIVRTLGVNAAPRATDRYGVRLDATGGDSARAHLAKSRLLGLMKI